jgi:hypothetical protein
MTQTRSTAGTTRVGQRIWWSGCTEPKRHPGCPCETRMLSLSVLSQFCSWHSQNTNFRANWINRGLFACEVTIPKPFVLPDTKPVPGTPNWG